MEDDTRIHQAVDEVAACIETARSVVGELIREVVRATVAGGQATSVQAEAGVYWASLITVRQLAEMLQAEADKAQAAVKYLGAKE